MWILALNGLKTWFASHGSQQFLGFSAAFDFTNNNTAPQTIGLSLIKSLIYLLFTRYTRYSYVKKNKKTNSDSESLKNY